MWLKLEMNDLELINQLMINFDSIRYYQLVVEVNVTRLN